MYSKQVLGTQGCILQVPMRAKKMCLQRHGFLVVFLSIAYRDNSTIRRGSRGLDDLRPRAGAYHTPGDLIEIRCSPNELRNAFIEMVVMTLAFVCG